MRVKTIILGSVMGIFLLIHDSSASDLKERLVFSPQEFQQVGISGASEVEPAGLYTLLCRLYAMTDPTLTDNTGKLDCRELEQYVFFTDVRRLDMNHDGIQDIVALVNDPSMASPNGVLVVYSLKTMWGTQVINTERATTKDTFVDVNDDGVYEICTNETILGDTPHALMDYWVNVYAWNGQAYLQQSEQFFESFYLQRYLPRVAQRLDKTVQGLKFGETRKNTASILQDCRTALERINAMSTAIQSSSSRKMGNEAETLHQQLPLISRQLEEAQTLLQHAGSLNEIANSIEKSRNMLQQLFPLPSPKTD